jgi:CubicO group peptidase (beta-lactamase class C family)
VYVACGFLNRSEILYQRELAAGGRNIFDLSSVTKALVTTPLALSYSLRAGRSSSDTSVLDLFGAESCSEFGGYLANLTLEQLLRHETGLPAWRNFYVECNGQKQSLTAALKLALGERFNDPHPGKNHAELYSDVGFMILGHLIEKTSGRALSEEWARFAKSIGFEKYSDLGSSSMIDVHRAVPSAFCPVRGRELVGEVHDENAWAMGGFTGHTGLFGTGAAICEFLQKLWQSDTGNKIISSNFDKADSPGDSLLGWRKGRDISSKTFASGRGCGHLGFTGTAFWVDPQSKSFAVVLTNRVISGRIPTTAIKDMRSKVFAGLWDVLEANMDS